MTRTILLILISAVVASFFSVAIVRAQGLRWTLINWKVRHDFPKVPRIDPRQLATWLSDAKREQPVLLDVRTKTEFEVSHLHGAQQIDPGSKAEAISLPRTKPIVTYCSVGYRSGAFAENLRAAGYQNVQNLSGSIFEWANEGFPVERDGHRVEKYIPAMRAGASC